MNPAQRVCLECESLCFSSSLSPSLSHSYSRMVRFSLPFRSLSPSSSLIFYILYSTYCAAVSILSLNFYGFFLFIFMEKKSEDRSRHSSDTVFPSFLSSSFSHSVKASLWLSLYASLNFSGILALRCARTFFHTLQPVPFAGLAVVALIAFYLYALGSLAFHYRSRRIRACVCVCPVT